MNVLTKLDMKIALWKIEAKKLKDSKAMEMKLRKEICTEIFENKQSKFKTEYKDLKLESNTTLKLDETMWEIYKQTIDRDCVELMAVQYKPALVAAVMKEIDEDSKFWDLITEQPAAPTIKINEKKEAFITLG